MSRDDKIHLGTVLFEFIRQGNSVKVSAIDPVTTTEVSIVGDPRVGVETLKRVATRKLEYVMARKGKAGTKQ
jgi:hypothetical protein